MKVLIPTGKEIGRPLNLFYPLAVTDKNGTENEKKKKTKEESDTQIFRPKSYAFEVARRRIKEIIRNKQNY